MAFLTAKISNADLVEGMVIVERSERGNVTAQLRVAEPPQPGGCDPHCVHVRVLDLKTNSGKVGCYSTVCKSEVRV